MGMDHLHSARLKIGLALGSGAARGWSHIGVIQALRSQGIEPDVVCGCSVGAAIGASYATGRLADLESWVHTLTRLKTAKFIELNSRRKGLVSKRRLHRFINHYVGADNLQIEALSQSFASVATDLLTGREIWFTSGSLVEAVWGSMSLPGMFPPMRHDGHWLVDGGLVNPVPVSVCRAMGADVVIAVNLNARIVGKHLDKTVFWRQAPRGQRKVFSNKKRADASKLTAPTPPGVFDVVAGSINIIQDRITRSRMAGDPPDVMLVPELAHLGLLEFYRGEEAIGEGRATVERNLPEIRRVCGID